LGSISLLAFKDTKLLNRGPEVSHSPAELIYNSVHHDIPSSPYSLHAMLFYNDLSLASDLASGLQLTLKA